MATAMTTREPVIWMDVLDWPLLEYLDLIWMRHDIPDYVDNASPETGFSQKLYGTGGLVPRFLPETRGSGQGGTPMFHFRGADVRRTLASLRDQTGSPWDGHPRRVCQPHERPAGLPDPDL